MTIRDLAIGSGGLCAPRGPHRAAAAGSRAARRRGSALVRAEPATELLLVPFVLLFVRGDFAASEMSSRIGVLAPVIIPLFTMVGVSPELTTAAWRIGDAVLNIITPLDS